MERAGLVGLLAAAAIGLAVGFAGSAESTPPCWARHGTCTTSATTTAPTTTGSPGAVTVPSSIAADCSADVTAQLQAWFDSLPDGTTASLAGGCFRAEGTLTLRGRNGLTIDGVGATLRASTVGDGHRSSLRVIDGSSFTVRDLTVEGGYTKSGTHDTTVQWSHGIDLLGPFGVLVENVTVRDVGGDCVYAGLGAQRARNATVRGVTCDGTGRNGVSAVAANGLLVDGGSYSRVGFIAFDVEPNSGTGFGVDGAVFDGATVGSYYLDAGMVVGDNAIGNVTFSAIAVTAAKGGRFRVLTPTTRRRTNIIVTGNTSAAAFAGDAVYAERTDGLTVTGNTLATSGVELRCVDDTAVTFSGNDPATSAGC